MALGGSTGYGGWLGSRLNQTTLHGETVAFRAPGVRVRVPLGQQGSVIPGTRVLADAPLATELVRQEREWLGAAEPWLTRSGPWRAMATAALLDLRILSIGLPAPVAAWSSNWRYVWPRDTAHVCAALAAVGHTDQAAAGLRFLQFVQGRNGRFEARYRPDATGPPDTRHPQLDGMGWALWGLGQVCARLPEAAAARTAASMGTLLRRATLGTLDVLDNPTGLPPSSPDYWEVNEESLTLGTAAPLLAGLDAARTLLRRTGDTTLAGRAATAGQRLDGRIHEAFGAVGYSRSILGGDRDAAVAFLLPPYTDAVAPTVVTALQRARVRMTRPAGGLAPGEGWPEDGVSWTPETALFAVADAELGDRQAAAATLRWLDLHRTAGGSYPEKVLRDGSPAAVAPLAWTAALVVLAVDALQRD